MMPPIASPSALEAKKTRLRHYIDTHLGPNLLTAQIVEEAASIFAPTRFSQAITSKRKRGMERSHRKAVEFMSGGRWITDDNLAAYIGCRVEAAGARRRELKLFGYLVESRQVSPGTWQHRLVASPSR